MARPLVSSVFALTLAGLSLRGAEAVLPGPRVPPTDPERAGTTLSVRPGFRMELLASEPLLSSPVALSVDEQGRAFVVEMRDYSERRPERLGRVRMLSDTNHDGRFDTASLFLPDLPWPTAVMCWDGGVFVGVTPDIWYAKDTDGDGVADVREVVFTGFASDYAPFATNQLNVQAMLNSMQWGLDCRIHGATSMSGGKVRRVASDFIRRWRARAGVQTSGESPMLDLRGRDFSFDPRTLELRAETGGGQHGMSLDEVGRKFVCSNSDHLQQIVYDEVGVPSNPAHELPAARRSIAVDGPAAEVFRKSPDEPWRVLRTRWRVSGVTPGMVEGGGRASGYFTGATGVTVYRGDDYGPEYRGDAFVADCGSNLIHRKKLRPSEDGVVWIGERASDEQRSEFVASTDNWFRPVQFYNAPDGCLWVIDMYRETIEHPWSIPAAIKQQLDLDSGRDRGRLWRLAPDPSPVPRTRTRLTVEGVSNRVALLGHPNGWHRDTAAGWLYARGGSEVIDALKDRARLGERAFPEGPGAAPGRIQVLGLLTALGALEDPVRIQSLRDPDPAVRGWAYREMGERLSRGGASDAVVSALVARVGVESDPRAALDLALSLAAVPENRRTPALAQLIQHPSTWVRSAAIHAAGGDVAVLWTAALGTATASQTGINDSVLVELALTLGRSGSPERIRAALGDCLRQQPEARSFELTVSLLEGVRRSGRQLRAMGLGEDLDPVLQRAVAVVRAGGAAIPPAAIRLLGVLPAEAALPVLVPGLVSSETAEVQYVFLATLGRLGGEVWARELASALGSAPSRLRSPIQALLLSRPEGAMELLRRLDAREWSFDRMDPAVLNRLRTDGNPAVRARAEAVLGEPPPSRQSVVESFIPALSVPGDAGRGQRQFQDRCSTCHAFRGQGISLGPDLASVVANGKEKLLVSILDPNREVAPNFTAWSAESTDGQTLSGILVRQGEDIVTLRQAGGAESTFKTSTLRALRPEGRSLMPEGLEAGWSSQDLADLLEYLSSR